MSSHSLDIPGLNIQFPWADLIISGRKTIETRFYPMPKKWIGRPIAIIETPGKQGSFRRRVVGIVIFGESFKYRDLQMFKRDMQRHLVDPKDPQFGWKNKDHPKWGWPVVRVSEHREELPQNFRSGIRYASHVTLTRPFFSSEAR